MEYGKIKRKVVKAGVELRVKNAEGTYVSAGFFANKLEAQVHAQRSFRGQAFTVTNVRVDATPIQYDPAATRSGRG